MGNEVERVSSEIYVLDHTNNDLIFSEIKMILSGVYVYVNE